MYTSFGHQRVYMHTSFLVMIGFLKYPDYLETWSTPVESPSMMNPYADSQLLKLFLKGDQSCSYEWL